MNTIKTSFTNDFQISHQLKVLDAIGVEIRFNIKYVDGKLTVTLNKIRFTGSFIEVKRLLNHPKINYAGFIISSIELFQLQMPNKTSLAQSALSSGFSPKQSNFEKIVDNLYIQSLKSVEQEQEHLTKQFTNVLNQNLIFLEEAISNFCSLRNKSLKW